MEPFGQALDPDRAASRTFSFSRMKPLDGKRMQQRSCGAPIYQISSDHGREEAENRGMIHYQTRPERSRAAPSRFGGIELMRRGSPVLMQQPARPLA
jgi:hypothetical protein